MLQRFPNGYTGFRPVGATGIEPDGSARRRVRRYLSEPRQRAGFATNWNKAYRTAGPSVRRRFNQAIFQKLYVDEEGNVTSDLQEPVRPGTSGRRLRLRGVSLDKDCRGDSHLARRERRFYRSSTEPSDTRCHWSATEDIVGARNPSHRVLDEMQRHQTTWQPWNS